MRNTATSEDNGNRADNTVAVKAEGLYKRFYPRDNECVTVLHDVNFSANFGQMTGIIGQSGSGKSTLMYCIAGLDQASAGSIRVLSQDITWFNRSRSAKFRRNHIGFVFQSYNLVPSMTVEGNLHLPFILRGTAYPEEEVDALLHSLDIANLYRTNVTLLSGGEQQRVALARVLITDPGIVFADEPTGALDTDSSLRVISELQKFARRPHHAVVMVTHSDAISARCDSVVRLCDGVLKEIKTSDDDFNEMEKMK